MDEIIARIIELAIAFDASLTNEDEEFLELIATDVVNRFLMYTNREQLITAWEQDDTKPEPVPSRIESVLARIVVGVVHSNDSVNSGDKQATKVKDGVQEVTYSDSVASSLASKSDAEVFLGSLPIIDRFRLATANEVC